MLEFDTAQLLFDTLSASYNDQADTYIAGLRNLVSRKHALDSTITLVEVQEVFADVLRSRYPRMDGFQVEHRAYIEAWKGVALVRQVVRGDFDAGGAYALPVEVQA